MESYVERLPLAGLAGVMRTVWIQRTGDAAYAQRHLPTGGCSASWSTRLTQETGLTSTFDVAAAVADYLAWRADNHR
jgi:hypothetical protein